MNNEITGAIYTNDNSYIIRTDERIKEYEGKIQAREKILKDLPKFKEKWGTLTDLTVSLYPQLPD